MSLAKGLYATFKWIRPISSIFFTFASILWYLTSHLCVYIMIHIKYALLSSVLSLYSKSLAELLHTLLSSYQSPPISSHCFHLTLAQLFSSFLVSSHLISSQTVSSHISGSFLFVSNPTYLTHLNASHLISSQFMLRWENWEEGKRREDEAEGKGKRGKRS